MLCAILSGVRNGTVLTSMISYCGGYCLAGKVISKGNSPRCNEHRASKLGVGSVVYTALLGSGIYEEGAF